MPKLRKRDIPSFPHKDSVQILKKQKQAKDSAADEDDMKSHPSVNDFLDWYLDGHDRKSLNKLVKNELLDMCKGRGIEHEGLKTKAAMIDELLRWVSLELIMQRKFLLMNSLIEKICSSAWHIKPESYIGLYS